jgi:hypothetical protein
MHKFDVSDSRFVCQFVGSKTSPVSVEGDSLAEAITTSNSYSLDSPHSVAVCEQAILDLAFTVVFLFVVKEGSLPCKVIYETNELSTRMHFKSTVSHSLELGNCREGHLSDILQHPNEFFFGNLHSLLELSLLLLAGEVSTPIQSADSCCKACTDRIPRLLSGHFDTVINGVYFENKFPVNSLVSIINLFFSQLISPNGQSSIVNNFFAKMLEDQACT